MEALNDEERKMSIMLSVLFLILFLVGWGIFNWFLFWLHMLGCLYSTSISCRIETFILVASISPLLLVTRLIILCGKKKSTKNKKTLIFNYLLSDTSLIIMVILNEVLLIML
jgi:hypothetical protein